MKLGEKPENNETATITAYADRRMSETDQRNILKEFSSSDYSDPVWRLDRMNRDKNPFLIETISFKDFSDYPQILSELKEWVVYQISSGIAERSIKNRLIPFRKMLKEGWIRQDSMFTFDRQYFLEYYSCLELDRTDIPNTANQYNWNTLKLFYQDMGAKEIWKLMDIFFLPNAYEPLKHREKLIPSDVINELDRIFYHENLPISFKLCYWILRLIPNRIEEVISIPFDCITLVDEDSYILKIPTFKQAGGYAKAQWRRIYLKNKGLGAYLKDLIQKQQLFLLDHLDKPEFLIADFSLRFHNGSFVRCNHYIKPFSQKRFNQILKRIIEIYDIRDKDDNPVHVTSHMFRHNAVTERIDSGLFSFHDIVLMSGHHTTTMLEIAYNHPDFNKTKETVLKFEEEIPEFKGKVLPGATEEDFKRLVSRPYAKEIGGLGVCRDVRGCKAQYYKCYGCEYFKIESKSSDKLKEEKTDWESKKLLAQRAGDKNFEDECESNINGINILLERIKNER